MIKNRLNIAIPPSFKLTSTEDECNIFSDGVDTIIEYFGAIPKVLPQSPFIEFENAFRSVYYARFFEELRVDKKVHKLFVDSVFISKIELKRNQKLVFSCSACNSVAKLEFLDTFFYYPFHAPRTTKENLDSYYWNRRKIKNKITTTFTNFQNEFGEYLIDKEILKGFAIKTRSGRNYEELGFKQIRFESQKITIDKTPQKITSIKIPLDAQHLINIYADTILQKTSSMARSKESQYAINGGFFSFKNQTSVTYLEINTKTQTLNNALIDSNLNSSALLNGALVKSLNGVWKIEKSKSDKYYFLSDKEEDLLITGPILIENNKESSLMDHDFNQNKHPRSCICIAPDYFIMLCFDGRQKNADGISLFSLQKYLKKINCKNAINLDGGGSTTLWNRQLGILNNPSDIFGERKVHSIIAY